MPTRHTSLNIAVISLMTVLMAACAVEQDLDGERIDLTDETDEEELVDVDKQLQDLQSGVLLIDRSGSMLTVRAATGNTRCVDALEMAREKVRRFFRDLNGRRIAIWTFKGDGVIPLHRGYVTSEASALSYVNGLSRTGCSGSTPLAEAMCRAVDGKPGSFVTLSPLPGYLSVLTDGYENNSDDLCHGPSGDIFTMGTWQNQVFTKMFGKVVLVDTLYWIPETILQLTGGSPDSDLPDSDLPDSDLPDSDLIDIEMGTVAKSVVPKSTCSNTAQCESHLFSYIQEVIGGTYGVVRDNDSDYPCSYGQCPPPKPPGTSGQPPPWLTDDREE